MPQRLHLTALLVDDYDTALSFFVEKLGFEVREDTQLGSGKRWVVIAPQGAVSGLLLARAVDERQRNAIGNQSGGRVFLFLETDDFARDHLVYTQRGVRFVEAPRHESYGIVAVFEADSYVADTYTIRHDPGDPWEGKTLDRTGFKDRVRQSRAAFPDQRFDIQGLFADDDGVVMTWLWNGTHRGDLPGFPATDRMIRMSGATVYMFDKEDRLTGHWQITDRLGVFQQLQRNR